MSSNFKFINSSLLIPVEYKISIIRKSLSNLPELLLDISNTLSISLSLKGIIILGSTFKFLWSFNGETLSLLIAIKKLKYDFKEEIFLLIDLVDKPFSDNSTIHCLTKE